MAEIRLVGVTKKFGDNTAVDHIDLTARDKEFIVLVGPSGCGKTTTGRSILRALSPTSGNVYFNMDGQSVNLATLPEKALKPLRTRMQNG